MKATLKEYSEEEYDDFLDEIYGDKDWCIEICWLKYRACKALYEVDTIAYNVWFSDWESWQDEIWVCSECDSEFDSEDEANECCEQLCPICWEVMVYRMVDIDWTNLVEQKVCLSCNK